MIFRRRRVRIEIEHTTLRVETGGLYGAEVISSARTVFDASSGTTLSLPTPEPAGPMDRISAVRNDAPTHRPPKGNRP